MENQDDADKSNRKLASVQEICYITPIEGKDKIVLAQVLGYQLIVDKYDFFMNPETKELDLKMTPKCVYFETDTIIDNENPGFAFMASRKFRVRTMKMAGVYSEGLAVPMSKLDYYNLSQNLEIGIDLTNDLKVKKYLSPEETKDRYPKKRVQKGESTDPRLSKFPSELFPKTDEPNLKSAPFMLNVILKENYPITVSEKYDGMSATYFNGRVFSRNYEHTLTEHGYHPSADTYLQIRDKYGLIEKTLRYPILAFQGEIIGPGCNKNRLDRKELEYYVFNIYDTKNQRYLHMTEVVDICKFLDLPTVPILHRNTCINELKEYQSLPSIMNVAENMEYPNGFPSEGLVIKTHSDGKIPRLSFKVVSRLYLDKIK